VPTSFLITEPRTDGGVPLARFLCAHGVGAGIETPFLTRIAALLAQRGIATYRFAFAYMTARQQGGTRRPPRAESLIGEYRAAAALMPTGVPVLIGGKSMGGRVASLIADDLFARGCIAGLVCLGYPFHPPKRPDQLRTRHLLNLACPALFVQGERDPFGTRAEVDALSLSTAIRLVWVRDGDHDLAARRGRASADDHLSAAADAVAAFACALRQPRR
jgi:predicted alpha/beta-hydrolase family hydrolase